MCDPRDHCAGVCVCGGQLWRVDTTIRHDGGWIRVLAVRECDNTTADGGKTLDRWQHMQQQVSAFSALRVH